MQRLFTPGPTPLPPEVLAVLASPPIHHRTPEAKAIFHSMNQKLQYLFQTSQPVLTLTCSGTGAAEAAITNVFSPEDKGIAIVNGKFAERWATMMQHFGMEVITVPIEWGKAATPDDIAPILQQHPDAACVWVVQSETSTGVWTDIHSIAQVVRQESNALFCVDGVTSVGCHECRMDDWGIDILFTGSQKGLMAPPGLAFLALSERAWRRTTREGMKSYYFNLQKARKSFEKDTTPWTPAISLVLAVEKALSLIEQEGLEHVWKRHADNTLLLRSLLQQAGLRFFGEQPSYAVTSVFLPEHLPTIVKDLRNRFSIVVASGQDHLVDTMFRIGHLGYYSELDMRTIASAITTLVQEAQS